LTDHASPPPSLDGSSLEADSVVEGFFSAASAGRSAGFSAPGFLPVVGFFSAAASLSVSAVLSRSEGLASAAGASACSAGFGDSFAFAARLGAVGAFSLVSVASGSEDDFFGLDESDSGDVAGRSLAFEAAAVDSSGRGAASPEVSSAAGLALALRFTTTRTFFFSPESPDSAFFLMSVVFGFCLS
tara:strand:- start:954 stop:1511 length:558 start_codon:yes stop_codon:yes gene_type:complete